MSQQPTGKTIILQPEDAQAKITDVVEAIIAGIMETGEVTVVGINDSMFLACSAINMATEIAKVYVDDIDIAPIQMPVHGKVAAIAAHLSQKQAGDYAMLAEQEEKKLTDVGEQAVSVSRASTMERLLTITLLRLAKFEEVKVVAWWLNQRCYSARSTDNRWTNLQRTRGYQAVPSLLYYHAQ